MAFNEKLADRVRELLAETGEDIDEKLMFGGICFMVNQKMCVCVSQERLMIRLNPAFYEEALEQEGIRPMNFTGRTMKGFVYAYEGAIDTQKKLKYWIGRAMDYNRVAKVSKKKTAKPKKLRG